MKRCLVLLILLSLVHLPIRAQDASAAAAAADRQAAEERFNRVAGELETLLADNDALKKRIAALSQELDNLREELAKVAKKDDSSIREDIKTLAEKIQEVDRKREADGKLIAEELKRALGKLEKTIASSVAAPATPKPPVHKEPVDHTPERGYTHTVESGDTLSGIVAAYNASFKAKGMKQITMKDVTDANPKVKWNRLLVGQKIVIPEPGR